MIPKTSSRRHCVLLRHRRSQIANVSFPAQSTLAKLCIEPIEPFDDIDGQMGLESGGNGSGASVGVVTVPILPRPKLCRAQWGVHPIDGMRQLTHIDFN
jgi:hypothetical protein